MATSKELLKVVSDLNKIQHGIDDTTENTQDTNQDMFALGEISRKLTDDEKINFLSIISNEEENQIATLYAVNEKLKSSLLKVYLKNKLELKVSVKGQGRKDLVNLSKSMGLVFASMMGLEGKGNILEDEQKGFRGMIDKLNRKG